MESVTGLILCGGRGRRMGGVDKGLLQVGGVPLVESAINSLALQLSSIIINANRSFDEYKRYNFPVVADETSSFDGPLAGVYAGLAYCSTEWLITVPCDAPNINPQLVEKLLTRATMDNAEICCASGAKRLQPTFCLYNVAVLSALREYLSRGERKIDLFFAERNTVVEVFEQGSTYFQNLNSKEDIVNFEKNSDR